jgi:hypothetical protein
VPCSGICQNPPGFSTCGTAFWYLSWSTWLQFLWCRFLVFVRIHLITVYLLCHVLIFVRVHLVTLPVVPRSDNCQDPLDTIPSVPRSENCQDPPCYITCGAMIWYLSGSTWLQFMWCHVLIIVRAHLVALSVVPHSDICQDPPGYSTWGAMSWYLSGSGSTWLLYMFWYLSGSTLLHYLWCCRALIFVMVHVIVVVKAGLFPFRQTNRRDILVAQSLNFLYQC